jgi:hypothetical protein
MEPADAEINKLARNLAKVLADYAYTRNPEDKKLIGQLQTRLCYLCGEVANAKPEQPSV